MPRIPPPDKERKRGRKRRGDQVTLSAHNRLPSEHRAEVERIRRLASRAEQRAAEAEEHLAAQATLLATIAKTQQQEIQSKAKRRLQKDEKAKRAAALEATRQDQEKKQSQQAAWEALQRNIDSSEVTKNQAEDNHKARMVGLKNMRTASFVTTVLTCGVCIAAVFFPVLIPAAIGLVVTAVAGVGVVLSDKIRKLELRDQRLTTLAKLERLSMIESSIAMVSKQLDPAVARRTELSKPATTLSFRGGVEKSTSGFSSWARSIGSSFMRSLESFSGGAEKESADHIKDSEDINFINSNINLLCGKLKIANDTDIDERIKKREGVLRGCVYVSYLDKDKQVEGYSKVLEKNKDNPRDIVEDLKSFIDERITAPRDTLVSTVSSRHHRGSVRSDSGAGRSHD